MKISFSVILLFVSIIAFSQELDLQYKFKTGDEYQYVQDSKQKSKQSIPGMGDVEMTASLGGAMILKVKEVTADGARIEAKYSKLNMSLNSMFMQMKMDSDGDQAESSNKIIKAMTGKAFYFTLSKTGSVSKVENLDNLFSDVDKQGWNESEVAKVKKSVQQALNPEAMRTILESGLIQYPGKKVKSGESWNTSMTQAISMPMKVENTWNVKSIEGKVASVVGDATMTTLDKEKVNTLPNAMKSKSDMTGQQAVVAKINTDTGWPGEVKILSEVKGIMTLLAGGMIPTDMEIPMTMEIETTYTITKK